MTFYKLLPPCVTRFNNNKASHEDRIKNEGDLPSEKLFSKNALLVMTSAIFVVQYSQISWKIFIICLHLIQNFKVETLSCEWMQWIHAQLFCWLDGWMVIKFFTAGKADTCKICCFSRRQTLTDNDNNIIATFYTKMSLSI